MSDASHLSPRLDQSRPLQVLLNQSNVRVELNTQPENNLNRIKSANQSPLAYQTRKQPMNNQSGQVSPNCILNLDNRYISSVMIERGIKLSPRASKLPKYPEPPLTSDQAETGLNKETYSGFENALTGQETSTPHRSICMKRSIGMFDLKSAKNGDLDTVRSSPADRSQLYLTDLSSDEGGKVLELSDDNPSRFGLSDIDLNIVPDNYRSVREQFNTLLSTPKKKAQNISYPIDRKELNYQERSGYKNVLAEQIDNEILELRNFFDDHREEMMSMLQGPQVGPNQMQHMDPPDTIQGLMGGSMQGKISRDQKR